MRIPENWGATSQEISGTYPCDKLLDRPADVWFRATTVHAAAPTVYRWLCQLKVAPYSYDMLDNFGRRSPRRLTPGVDSLATGDTVMTIFRLVEFARDDHLTLKLHTPVAIRIFGELAISYVVREVADHQTRLCVKMRVTNPPGLLGEPRRKALAWGDLLMMRRQLRTFKELAEAS
ncbi:MULTISPECIES: hypothetical protein [unclassified Actinopolyspora]|uniref:hypothetical protein n=1 Tax=unclassified Actinopolyspora TaxID=2639451 RepID=UPI0013F6907C|nr:MULTISPECIES: hypothetical protein [unclassified Actinopolyspora]NHD19095.1 hypothetical protein [Actinopolyspora sp. BKK2]NHE78120.1 hypothetical protein [Actinopolyspora sp. BKK1]